MEVINNYIDSLYKNDNSQEVLELKEELKEHLIMSANEFINEGYEEQDACEMAIKKFDGGSEMLKELYFTLKENKKEIKETNKVAKIITRISGVMFIICLITSTILTYHKTVNYIYDKPFIYWQQVNSNISKELNKIIKDKDVKKDIDSYKDDISKLVMIFWCLFIFITCGFEHSVANMTLLTIALLAPGTAAVSVSGYIYNIGMVTLGNMVGGILFVAIPYYLISKKSQ